MKVGWSDAEDELLAAGWRNGATMTEIAASLPRHSSEAAVKQRIIRLRAQGVSLPYRRVKRTSDAERAQRRAAKIEAAHVERERAKAARELAQRREVPDPWKGVRFLDDPRAHADHGSPTAYRELGHSPTGSSLA